MDRIFNMDNKFFTFMSRVADLIILNLLFLATCIPVVTLGAGLTAMYYVTLKMARNEESYIVRSFLKSFKENFRQATAIWLMDLGLIILMVMDFTIMKNVSGGFYSVVKYGLAVIVLILAMVTLYVFPLLAKFVNTVKHTIKNALLMSLRHLPYTLLMLVICIAPFIVMLLTTQTLAYGILFMFLFGFATIAFFQSKFFVKIFDKYIPSEEDENPEEAAEDNEDAALTDSLEEPEFNWEPTENEESGDTNPAETK